MSKNVRKLDDENYDLWLFEVEMELKARKLWRYCVDREIEGESDPEGHAEAIARIAMSIDIF